MSQLLAIPSWRTYQACCTCGVAFDSPLLDVRRNDGEWFYCPNGHRQHYIATEAQRLRGQLDAALRERDWARSQQETAEASARAYRAHASRVRNKLRRVQCGVCPECNRSFTDLREHMKTKHGGAA